MGDEDHPPPPPPPKKYICKCCMIDCSNYSQLQPKSASFIWARTEPLLPHIHTRTHIRKPWLRRCTWFWEPTPTHTHMYTHTPALTATLLCYTKHTKILIYCGAGHGLLRHSLRSVTWVKSWRFLANSYTSLIEGWSFIDVHWCSGYRCALAHKSLYRDACMLWEISMSH